MTELIVKRLGHQGLGMADGPNGDVLIPFCLPGEKVEGDIVNGRMSAPKIRQASDQRVAPPCPHFKSCGGCALQHVSDGFMADWKIGLVKAALAPYGLNPPFKTLAVSPARSRRRATLAGRRTKKGALVGFHGRASGVVIEIPSCTLLHPDILRGFKGFEALVKLGASRKGEISLAVTQSDAGLDVDVTGGKPTDGPLLTALGQTVQAFDFARLSWNGEVIATDGLPVQEFGTTTVVPPPGAFLQATKAGETALVAAVKQAIGPSKKVVDLFAGCGTFTLPVAAQAFVLAAESDESALTALDTAWRGAEGLHSVRTEVRDLFRRPLMPDELKNFEAAIIDPPRAGAKAQTAEIAASSIRCVAFVSCNPVTFARDAKTLVDAGFEIEWIQVVDQFRWSPHVEMVAKLTRP